MSLLWQKERNYVRMYVWVSEWELETDREITMTLFTCWLLSVRACLCGCVGLNECVCARVCVRHRSSGPHCLHNKLDLFDPHGNDEQSGLVMSLPYSHIDWRSPLGQCSGPSGLVCPRTLLWHHSGKGHRWEICSSATGAAIKLSMNHFTWSIYRELICII